MKNNIFMSNFRWLYSTGFFIILALPVLTIPPYFFPADWGKSIVFRSIMAIVLFLFIFQILFIKKDLNIPDLKKNLILQTLSAIFIVFLLATIFSTDPYFSLWGNPYRGGGFVTFAFYFVFAVLSFILFKKPFDSSAQGGQEVSTDSTNSLQAGEANWNKALNFSIIIGVIVSLIGVAQFNGLFNLSITERPPSTMGNPIILAIYILFLFFITISFAVKEDTLWKKILYALSLALFAYVILITGARAVYFGVAVGILYFFLFYPKKNIAFKIIPFALLVAGLLFIFYVNNTLSLPKIFEENKILKSITYRFSTDLLSTDPRFGSWQVSLEAVKSKPVLGHGPENFSVGFDKHYNPSIPYLDIKEVGWWDRAHNVLLDVATSAGIPALIAYLALFIALFWQLQEVKDADLHKSKTDLHRYSIMAHGVQATLLAYFAANFFSFDTFSTYLIFFLLIGYTLHLTTTNLTAEVKQKNIGKGIKFKKFIMSAALVFLIIFLWQYNLVPFLINGQINKASDLAKQKKCDQALSIMDNALIKHSFLDSYARMEYVEFTKECLKSYPEKNIDYIKKDLELIKEAVKIQPLYTRYWIFLGSGTTTLAKQETNLETKKNLLVLANNYFNKALQLAPKHQEILIGQAKMALVAEDYEGTKNYSEKCVALNSDLGDCYFYLALLNIYLKDEKSTQKNLEAAFSRRYDINSKESLDQLADAYGYISDYKNLVPIFSKLITINPNVAQYHSSLAFFYRELGQYADAKQEALKVLQLSPESKPNVDAFLKTLP